MNNITYPTAKTYYILKDGSEIKSYGSVETNQVLETIFTISNTYTLKSEWLTELENNGIDTSEL